MFNTSFNWRLRFNKGEGGKGFVTIRKLFIAFHKWGGCIWFIKSIDRVARENLNFNKIIAISIKDARPLLQHPLCQRPCANGDTGVEERRARRRREWKSDLVTSKFNKRHKPIQPAIRAAKTRRAIKVVIKRSPFSRPARAAADGRRSEGGRREKGQT